MNQYNNIKIIKIGYDEGTEVYYMKSKKRDEE